MRSAGVKPSAEAKAGKRVPTALDHQTRRLASTSRRNAAAKTACRLARSGKAPYAGGCGSGGNEHGRAAADLPPLPGCTE